MTRSAPPRSRIARASVAACLADRLPRLLGKVTLLVLAACLLPFLAQAAAPDSAKVIFSLDFPNSEPEHYSISVNSDGHARYECSARVSPDSDEREPYQTEFEMTPATRARIFELAAQAHYFSGKIDSGNSKLAFTGSKKLAYQDSQRNYSATYNYSTVAAVQQLTTLFQGMAATLDYGRRLAYYYRYQKLALDEELKHMETQAKNNDLSELQAVDEVLKRIMDDPSVINVVRARAQRLVQMAHSRTPSR
jgi:hypothetical protein